jgi:hypothetical protein
VRDNSNGQRPIYAFNRANPANAPNAGIVLDGSNGLSDVWLWSNGVDVLELNSPSRVRYNGQIQMGGAPTGSNYAALDAGTTILDTSASPADEYRVLDDGTLVGPL